jgi:MATE family, multidrug efflux pump
MKQTPDSTEAIATDRSGPLREARFVSGSILRHILVMTGAGAIGLVSIFAGDLANLLFLGQLHDTEVLAAVGYASTLLFFSVSVGIGLTIGATAAVAPAIGGGRRDEACRLATSALLTAALVGSVLGLAIQPFLGTVLDLIGAHGRTQSLAVDYLSIVFPSFPLMAVGMTASGILRSAGDAQRSMYVTLSGAIVNVVLDAILILGLGFGLHGAAWSIVAARLVITLVGMWGVWRVHQLLARPILSGFWADCFYVLAVGLPAIATNLATPVANAFVTRALAGFGDAAIAAWSVYGRVSAVAFGAIFAMTSSISPIVGQNLGAGDFRRVKQTIFEAARVTAAFTAFAWAVLAMLPGAIVASFGLGPESAPLIILACRWLSPLFLFLGFLFIANAVFNTLRHPHYATLFNWGRATLGTIPFVILGGRWAGAAGVFTGSMVSGVLVGVLALWVCFRLVDRLAREKTGRDAPG